MIVVVFYQIKTELYTTFYLRARWGVKEIELRMHQIDDGKQDIFDKYIYFKCLDAYGNNNDDFVRDTMINWKGRVNLAYIRFGEFSRELYFEYNGENNWEHKYQGSPSLDYKSDVSFKIMCWVNSNNDTIILTGQDLDPNDGKDVKITNSRILL